jgi:hypothetical protein
MNVSFVMPIKVPVFVIGCHVLGCVILLYIILWSRRYVCPCRGKRRETKRGREEEKEREVGEKQTR